MKTPQMHYFAAALVAAVLAGDLPGQTQAAPTGTTGSQGSSSVIELDEFIVTETQDDHYRATNVLSGTRFNTSLLDLPVPVDVVTREFMNDIGAIDIAEGCNTPAASRWIARVTTPGRQTATCWCAASGGWWRRKQRRGEPVYQWISHLRKLR